MLGTIFDRTNSWIVPVLILCAVSIATFFVGMNAGKIHPEEP